MYCESLEGIEAAKLPGNKINSWYLPAVTQAIVERPRSHHFRDATPKLQGARLYVSSAPHQLKLTNAFKSLDFADAYDDAPAKVIAKMLEHKDSKIEWLTRIGSNAIKYFGSNAIKYFGSNAIKYFGSNAIKCFGSNAIKCFGKTVSENFKAMLNALKHENNKIWRQQDAAAQSRAKAPALQNHFFAVSLNSFLRVFANFTAQF
ncbi:hypothetical protein BASA81_010751 [Batrachochytrium salamandrivorans]|nr:hypothetical protein BASA81_010751 [Batrachochytrium salamandrivorans]